MSLASVKGPPHRQKTSSGGPITMAGDTANFSNISQAWQRMEVVPSFYDTECSMAFTQSGSFRCDRGYCDHKDDASQV